MIRCLSLVALMGALLSACVPDFTDDTALVAEPRLLAIQNVPAETRPGQSITATSLWVGRDGLLADGPIDWAFCTARKALSESGPVASACLEPEGDALIALGVGPTATGALPSDGCRRFGPDRPDPEPGETAPRPTDPDGTGGYYQPIRVLAEATVSLAQARIQCGLPEATPEQSMRFASEYVPNLNPTIESAALGGEDLVRVETDAAATRSVRAGETVTLDLVWPACDAAPCGGAEPYLWFDPTARRLLSRREAMRVAWYATAGAFATTHTGQTEAMADEPRTSNEWTAPAATGTVFLWAVLRDDRGGATWATFRLDVAP